MDNMDEGVLKLTNHKDHPTNKAYKVFFFYKEEQSEYFKEMLDKNNIFYEFGIDENNQRKVFLFGIRKSDNAQVLEINYTTFGFDIFNSEKLKNFILDIS